MKSVFSKPDFKYSKNKLKIKLKTKLQKKKNVYTTLVIIINYHKFLREFVIFDTSLRRLYIFNIVSISLILFPYRFLLTTVEFIKKINLETNEKPCYSFSEYI